MGVEWRCAATEMSRVNFLDIINPPCFLRSPPLFLRLREEMREKRKREMKVREEKEIHTENRKDAHKKRIDR